jgi:hypothetical protein
MQVLPSETFDDWVASRLLIVFNKSINIPIYVGKLIEGINAIQIVFNILIVITLGIIYLRKGRLLHKR